MAQQLSLTRTCLQNMSVSLIEASATCRLEELMPAGVWDAIDVSSLERGIADLEYRGAVLRDEYGVWR